MVAPGVVPSDFVGAGFRPGVNANAISVTVWVSMCPVLVGRHARIVVDVKKVRIAFGCGAHAEPGALRGCLLTQVVYTITFLFAAWGAEVTASQLALCLRLLPGKFCLQDCVLDILTWADVPIPGTSAFTCQNAERQNQEADHGAAQPTEPSTSSG